MKHSDPSPYKALNRHEKNASNNSSNSSNTNTNNDNNGHRDCSSSTYRAKHLLLPRIQHKISTFGTVEPWSRSGFGQGQQKRHPDSYHVHRASDHHRRAGKNGGYVLPSRFLLNVSYGVTRKFQAGLL